MPRILRRQLTVGPDAIDVNGHVNNLTYLRWMQESAIEHSAVQGWPVERYLALGAGWVVRSHFIEYLAPAFAGETLTLLTWVAGLERWRSPRRFLFWRARDRKVVARAETLWVFVESATGRPSPIPADLSSAFEIVTSEAEVSAALESP